MRPSNRNIRSRSRRCFSASARVSMVSGAAPSPSPRLACRVSASQTAALVERQRLDGSRRMTRCGCAAAQRLERGHRLVPEELVAVRAAPRPATSTLAARDAGERGRACGDVPRCARPVLQEIGERFDDVFAVADQDVPGVLLQRAMSAAATRGAARRAIRPAWPEPPARPALPIAARPRRPRPSSISGTSRSRKRASGIWPRTPRHLAAYGCRGVARVSEQAPAAPPRPRRRRPVPDWPRARWPR